MEFKRGDKVRYTSRKNPEMSIPETYVWTEIFNNSFPAQSLFGDEK